MKNHQKCYFYKIQQKPKTFNDFNLTIMDFIVLFQTFWELEEIEGRSEILDDLINFINEEKNIPIANINKFLEFIVNVLKLENKEHKLKILRILEATIHFLTSELEFRFSKISACLIEQLRNPDENLFKKLKELFCLFLRKTRNLQLLVSDFIKFGLKNENSLVQERSLQIIPLLLELENNVCLSRTGIIMITELIENIMICTRDESKPVRKQSKELIHKIYNLQMDGMMNVYKRFSVELKTDFDEIVEKIEITKDIEFPEFETINIENIEGIDEIKIDLEKIKMVYYNMQTPNNLNEKQILHCFENDRINGLYFGFIPNELMKDSANQLDNKFSADAISEISKLVIERKIFNNSSVHLRNFLKFLIIILKQTKAFRIISCIYSIIHHILNKPGIEQKIFLPPLLIILIEKLAEDRITIRNQTVQLIKKMIKYISSQSFLEISSIFLDPNDSSNDWFLKYELLMIITFLFLSEDFIKDKEKIPFFVLNNFKVFLNKISLLLSNKVIKVKKAALETLAVICNHFDQTPILEILHELVEKKDYEELLDKLEKNNLFYIDNNGALQKNINDSNNSEPTKNFVDFSLKEENQIKRPESEKSNIILHPEKKSYAARVKEQNDNLEKLSFYLETENVDTNQNDSSLYININDIKMTDGKNQLEKGNKRVNHIDKVKIAVHGEEKKQSLKQEELSLHSKKDLSENIIRINQEFSLQNMNNISPSLITSNTTNYLKYTYDKDIKSSSSESSDSSPFPTKKMIKISKIKKTEESSSPFHQPVESKFHAPFSQKKDPIPLTQVQKLERFLSINEDNSVLSQLKTPASKSNNERTNKNINGSPRKNMNKNGSSPKEKNGLSKNKDILDDENSVNKSSSSSFKKKKNNPVNNLISLSQIKELLDPRFSMHRVLIDMKSPNWEEQDKALLAVRSLAKFNIELLYDLNFSIPHLINDICELSNSLRSTISRHSLVTLNEMVESLKKSVNSSVERLVETVLKQKTGVSNFLDEEANKLMINLVSHCDETKIMDAIYFLLSKDRKNYVFKSVIGQFMELIIQKQKSNIVQVKLFSKFITLLVNLVHDANFEVRKNSKKALFKFLNVVDLEKDDLLLILQKNLPTKEFEELQVFMDKMKTFENYKK